MNIIRRFLVAYLAAAILATLVVIVVQSAHVLASGLGFEALHDVAPTALIYGMYSLGFTLVLGLPGWLVLRLFGWGGALPYAVVGFTLGFLAVAAMEDGFRVQSPFLFSFPAAGIAAALTFRWLFNRVSSRRISRRAAA